MASEGGQNYRDHSLLAEKENHADKADLKSLSSLSSSELYLFLSYFRLAWSWMGLRMFWSNCINAYRS